MSATLVDLGDPLPDLSAEVYDSTGVLANASSVVLTITLPDGSTTTPSVTNASTGVYTATYVTVQRGWHVASWVASGTNACTMRVEYNVAESVASIIGLADAQQFLNVTQTSLEDDVRAVALAASDVVENYCGRTWRRQSVTETYDGGQWAINLRRTPVISVTTVTENGTATTDYTLDQQAGILHRGSTTAKWRWVPGTQNISVTYVAGSTVIPQPVIHATRQVMRVLWGEMEGGAKVPTDEFAAPVDLIPRTARMALDAYRAPGF